jgi:hypothetical protein
MGTIFNRPRARPPLQSVSHKQVSFDVRTEDELISALTYLGTSSNECYGVSLNIAAPITLKQTIVLNERFNGIRIYSESKARISTSKKLDSMFKIQAFDVTISNLTIAELASCVAVFYITSPQIGADLRIAIENIDLFANPAPPVDARINMFIGIGVSTNGVSLRSNNVIGENNGDPIFIIYNKDEADLSTSDRYIANFTISENSKFKGGIYWLGIGGCVISDNIDLGSIQASGEGGLTDNIINGNKFAIIGGIFANYSQGTYNNIITNNNLRTADIDIYKTTTPRSGGANVIVGNSGVNMISHYETDAVTSNTLNQLF